MVKQMLLSLWCHFRSPMTTILTNRKKTNVLTLSARDNKEIKALYGQFGGSEHFLGTAVAILLGCAHARAKGSKLAG